MEDLWWRSRLLQISGKTHAQLSQVLKILDYLLSHLWLSGSSWLIISISFYFFLLTPQTSSLFIYWCTFTCMAESVGCSVVSWLFGTPWTIAHQAPLSIGFSRQEYWSGLPCPSPEDLPDSGFELGVLHCRQILYHLSHQDHLRMYVYIYCCLPPNSHYKLQSSSTFLGTKDANEDNV